MTTPRRPACVLALDQGTTSSRAILFDRSGRPLAIARQAFPQVTRTETDGAGGELAVVEHDPEQIWGSQLACARRVLAAGGITAADIAAIGIANQRETTILWERSSGRPVAPAIVWQSRVSAPICARLEAAGLGALVRERTGLLLDPYFSATKIMHLMETVPGLRGRCAAGDVLFGTVDTFLVWRLTGGRVHATDVTNASRTLLFDIRRQAWSEQLCEACGIPPAMLPEVRPSAAFFGETERPILGDAIPIGGCAGDQQAAAFGQGCVARGDAKTTYGTGAFLLFSTGAAAATSRHGLLTTPACLLPGAVPGYHLEGSVFVAGALVDWLRDGLGLCAEVGELEPLARSVADAGGLVLVPALTGLGAPHWDPFARGLVIGITRSTTRGHVARAALEAIALSVADVVGCMERDAGAAPARMRVDGGASGNDLLMQTQADVLGCPVERPLVRETTALGAALLAGITSGFYADSDSVAEARRAERVFEPGLAASARERLLGRWRDAVDRCRSWAAGG